MTEKLTLTKSMEIEAQILLLEEKSAALLQKIAAANVKRAALEKEAERLRVTKHPGGRPTKASKKNSPRPPKKIILNLKHRDLKKMSEDLREMIRCNFKNSGMSLRQHAKLYNISDTHLKNIISPTLPARPRKTSKATAE